VYLNRLSFADRKNPRWIVLTLFTSGSRSFLESLHLYFKKKGIKKGSISKKLRGYELKFSHADTLALYRLMYNTGQVSNLFLPRKREKLERAIHVLRLGNELRS